MGKFPVILQTLAAVLLLTAGGCATRGDVGTLRSDIAGLRSLIEADAAARDTVARPDAAAAQAGTPAAGTVGAGPGTTAGPPPAEYKKVSTLVDLPEFMPGLGTLYVQPQTLPAGPFLAYDRDDRLVSTIYMIPVSDLGARKRFEDLAAADGAVRSVDFYHNPGHPGVETPHYHVVLWHVPKGTAKLE